MEGDEIEFRKSSFSFSNGNCVEVAFVNGGARQVLVRDSKHRGGAVLGFTESEWDAFVKGVRAGEFG
jgi:putative sterol carrier protein